MIKNPILPGFNPDPCICRKGEDYYMAVSSFEWFPGIPLYHSKDLKNWELYTHVLTDDSLVDLKKLPSAKGIWAPCLTYCEEEDLFYVVYGVMNSMNARYFDVDNYLITAKDIKGPWSEPVYIHSSGFDASILHDDDGRKYIVSLEWETREGYEKPGAICMVEYSKEKKEIVGYPKRIWSGGTDRGCIEAPHLTKRGDYYYIMCAEGGTGYGHSVTMGRAKNVWGPYEGDPTNPILTSIPGDFYERHDPDHLKPKYFNPESVLQKSGHGSYVETQLGEVYMVHLTARPFVPELRCTLGRETAIQKMKWTDDGWLRMADGSNLAKEYVEESKLPEYKVPEIPDFDDFDSEELGLQYYAPRIIPSSFADVKARPGYVRIRGQESRCSLNKVSILARKLTSVYATVTTKMEFKPEVHQHSAGLIIYYDNMNYIYLRKYYSETLGQSALSIIHLENGEKTEFLNTRIPVDESPIYLRLKVEGRQSYFEWSYDGEVYNKIGKVFDTTKFSDEYCKYGEFTGTFVGITCADRVLHKHYADFDFFNYEADETIDVNF
ncbi:glycoside hydrolase family 43 protein [Clostridium sp.]|uniref:glycoside hydrolase family 43 protein n=1 Tax=Clostridium sp. TaxID=1506 RepID=UPI0026169D1C|nr:glycoside hydrolase family 43 protein [Clostridium sp.]